MAWRSDNPSVVGTSVIDEDTTLTANDITTYGNFPVDTSSAAVTVTLPVPDTALADSYIGACIIITNDGTAGNHVTIACTNGFTGDADALQVADGQSRYLYVYKDSDNEKRWSATDSAIGEWQAWTLGTMTVTGGAIFADTTVVSRYRYVGPNTVEFQLNIEDTDGNAAAGSSWPLPVTAKDIDCARVPVPCNIKINATWTAPVAYIQADGETGTSRVYVVGTFTDGQAAAVHVHGFYEV